MKKFCLFLIATLLILLDSNCYAQAPTVHVPQAPKALTIPTTNHSINPYNSFIPNNGFNQQAQQEAIMREVQAHQRKLQATSNNDNQDIQNEIQRQMDILMLTKHGFPSLAEYETTLKY